MNITRSKLRQELVEVHKGIYWYSTDAHSPVNLTPVPVTRVREIQLMNRKGLKPDKLVVADGLADITPVSEDLLRNNSLTRFDTSENKNLQHKHSHKRKNRRFNVKK